MTPEQLVARLLDQRREWVEVGEVFGLPAAARRVRIVRPAESEMPKLRGILLADLAAAHVDGWDGFIEADLLGPAGASDAIAFDLQLWRAWVADKADLVAVVGQAVIAAVDRHLQARVAAAKN